MTDPSVTAKPGERFRRAEVANRLHSLADLIAASDIPVHRFDRTPLIEFHLASEAEVDRVAAELGQTPKRFSGEYFTGIDNAELRVRWTAYDAVDTGLAYSRADEADDPTPVSGGRVEPHVGAMTDAGQVEGEPPVQHSHAGGSFGGPGENSAECACGDTYDGFDTPAEANLRLAMHIDSANSPES